MLAELKNSAGINNVHFSSPRLLFLRCILKLIDDGAIYIAWKSSEEKSEYPDQIARGTGSRNYKIYG
jgi:hypothetical protein